MQLKSLRLGAVALAGALLLAVALPAPPASAQAADDPAISSLSEAEQLRIQRAVLDRLWGIREFREREIRDLRSGYTSSAAREYLEAQIAWIDDIEQGDPRIMYEQTVERFLPTAISILRPTALPGLPLAPAGPGERCGRRYRRAYRGGRVVVG
ncbi:MAG: hypothetical protein IH905_06460 [Proteobacteria bacterium]|nr:hypothetical protein [Pseudomonadota bacterium]